jgi:hypothetical protein
LLALELVRDAVYDNGNIKFTFDGIWSTRAEQVERAIAAIKEHTGEAKRLLSVRDIINQSLANVGDAKVGQQVRIRLPDIKWCRLGSGAQSAIAAHDYIWGDPGVLGSQGAVNAEAQQGAANTPWGGYLTCDTGDETDPKPPIPLIEEVYAPTETEEEKQSRLWKLIQEFSTG